MNHFVANLADKNLDRLERASTASGVDFMKGTLMSIGDQTELTDFRPIFCEDSENGRRLLQQYVELALAEDARDSLRDDFVVEKGGIPGILNELKEKLG